MEESARDPLTPNVELPDWVAAARRRGVLARVSDRVAADFIKGGRRATYPAGSTLVNWDSEPAGVLILAGGMRVYLPAHDGSQITLRYVRAGDIVGTFSEPPNALVRSLEALDRAEVLHLDVPLLAALMRSQPDLAWEMFNEMNRTLHTTHRAYAIHVFSSMRARVAYTILERARTRGDVVPEMLVAWTQHDLAVAAGTVREVVARALKDLKREGIVDVRRGGVVIRDPERLADEAGSGSGFGSAAS